MELLQPREAPRRRPPGALPPPGTDPMRALCLPRAGREQGTELVPLSHPCGSWALISRARFNEGRMGAALTSPDGESLPCGARGRAGRSKPRHGTNLRWRCLGAASAGGKGSFVCWRLWEGPRNRAGEVRAAKTLPWAKKSLLGALKRSLDAAGRVLPLVSSGLEVWDASQRTSSDQGIPYPPREALPDSGRAWSSFLPTRAQSGLCLQVSLPWLLAVQDRGTTGGIRGPSLCLCCPRSLLHV